MAKANGSKALKARAKALVGRNEAAAAARASIAFSGAWGNHDNRPARQRTRLSVKNNSVADSHDQ
jgi:hypothetical protein